MAEKKIGAKIVIDGEKEYREAIKNINTAQKELRSEMRLCSTQYADTQNSMDALNAKAEVLTKQIDSQKQKIEIYSNAVEASNKKQEDAKKHLDSLSDQYEKAEKELEKMRKSADVSNEELEEQEKIVSSLKLELGKAADYYNAAERSTSSWQTSLNNAQADLHTMESNLDKTNQYLQEAKTSSDGCATSIDNLGKEVKDAGEQTTRFGDVLKANLASDIIVNGAQKLCGLIKEAGQELVQAAVNAALFADEIATLSVQTGVSTDTLQELTYAQELMDVSVETVTSSMAKNIKSMQNARKGSVDYVDAYKKLGVQITTTNGQFKDSEKVYWEVVDALGKMENATERDSLAMTLFGKKAQELNTLIELGSDGFKEYADEAHEVGFVLDEEMLNSLLATSDAMERMKSQTEAAKNQIGAELAPVLEDAYGRIGDAVVALSDDVADFAGEAIPKLVDGFEWILENSDVVITAMAGIGTAIAFNKVAGPATDALNALANSWGDYSAKVETATVKTWLLNAAQNASPIMIITTAIIALTGAVIAYNAIMDDEANKVQVLNEKYKDLKKQIEESNKAHVEATQNIKSNEQSNLTLLKSLIQLNSAESKTATNKKQIADIVEQLNSSMANLNLQYNEETGALSLTNEQLEQYIENMAEQEQYEENVARMNVLLQEQAQIETELAEAQALASTEVNRYNDLVAENKVAQLTIDLENNKTEYQELAEACNGYTGALAEQEEAMQSGIDVSVEYNEQQYLIKDTTQEVADSITELQTAYYDAKTAAEESIQGQVGLFEELAIKSDMTVEQMSKNLGTQTEAFNQYTADLNAAAELMSAGASPEFEKIVQSLMDMGINGAGYLHELVVAAQGDSEAFNEVLAEFGEMETAKESLATTMADLQTNYTAGMDEILGIQTTKNEEQIANEQSKTEAIKTITQGANDELVTDTTETMAELNTTIIENTPVVEESMTNMANKMIMATNSALGRLEGQSPKFKEIGKGVMEDLADGITSGSSLVTDAIQQSVQEAIDNVDVSDLADKLDKVLGKALA